MRLVGNNETPQGLVKPGRISLGMLASDEYRLFADTFPMLSLLEHIWV